MSEPQPCISTVQCFKALASSAPMKTGAASPAERSAAGGAAAGDEGLAFTAFLLCLMAVVDFMAFMDLMDGTRERNWKGKNLQNVCSGKP